MKSKLLVLFVILLSQLLLISCVEKTEGVKIDYMPVQIEEDGSWSFIGHDGKIIMKDVFDEDNEPSPIVNDVFYVDGKEGKTVYRIKDDTFTEIEGLSGLAYVGYMQDGLIPVCKKGERIIVVDINGSTKFELSQFDNIEVDLCKSYSEGLMLVKLQDGTILYVDTNGENAFGRRFGFGSNFYNGYAFVKELDEDGDSSGSVCIINKEGDVVYKFKKSMEIGEEGTIEFNKQLFSVENNEKMCIYNFSGEEKCRCPSKVEDTGSLLEDYYIYKNDDGEYGVMDYENKQLIHAKYKQMIPLGRYFLCIGKTDDEEIKLVDIDDNELKTIDGKIVVKPQNFGFDFPVIIDTDNDEMYMIDNKANIINNELYACINYDFFVDDNFGEVESCYAPIEEIAEQMSTLTDKPSVYGAFINNGEPYCYPKDVTFVRSASIKQLEDKHDATMLVNSGLNFSTKYTVNFDWVIVKKDSTTLSNDAWLKKISIKTSCDERHISSMVSEALIGKLIKKGYRKEAENELYPKRYMFVSDKDNYVIGLQEDMDVTLWIDCKCKTNAVRQWLTTGKF